MLKAGQKVKQRQLPISTKGIVSHFGYSRAGYYKACTAKKRKSEESDVVLDLVKRERGLQSRLACDKIFHLIKGEMQGQGIKMGRDKLYALLREKGLLLKRRKRQGPRTTDSRHDYKRFGNLVKDKVIDAPNQVWVCDMTYLRVGSSWMYLCLVMDAYSRKIVGWCLHDTLEMLGCRQALNMAIKSLPKGFAFTELIHHSDHGVQYCCHVYRALLKKRGIQISMAAVGDCYENAQAERLNGILKQEYGLGDWLPTKAKACMATKQAIERYNTRRPHRALKLEVPAEVHAGKKVDVRMGWPKKRSSQKVA